MNCVVLKIVGSVLVIGYITCFLFQTWAIYLNLRLALNPPPRRCGQNIILHGPVSLTTPPSHPLAGEVFSSCEVVDMVGGAKVELRSPGRDTQSRHHSDSWKVKVEAPGHITFRYDRSLQNDISSLSKLNYSTNHRNLLKSSTYDRSLRNISIQDKSLQNSTTPDRSPKHISIHNISLQNSSTHDTSLQNSSTHAQTDRQTATDSHHVNQHHFSSTTESRLRSTCGHAPDLTHAYLVSTLCYGQQTKVLCCSSDGSPALTSSVTLSEGNSSNKNQKQDRKSRKPEVGDLKSGFFNRAGSLESVLTDGESPRLEDPAVVLALYTQVAAMLGILACTYAMTSLTWRDNDVTGTLSMATVCTAILGLLSCLLWTKATRWKFEETWHFPFFLACFFYVLTAAIPVLTWYLIRRSGLGKFGGVSRKKSKGGAKVSEILTSEVSCEVFKHLRRSKCEGGFMSKGGAKNTKTDLSDSCCDVNTNMVSSEARNHPVRSSSLLRYPAQGHLSTINRGYPCRTDDTTSFPDNKNTVTPEHYRHYLAVRRADDVAHKSGSRGAVTSQGAARETTPLLREKKPSVNLSDDGT